MSNTTWWTSILGPSWWLEFHCPGTQIGGREFQIQFEILWSQWHLSFCVANRSVAKLLWCQHHSIGCLNIPLQFSGIDCIPFANRLQTLWRFSKEAFQYYRTTLWGFRRLNEHPPSFWFQVIFSHRQSCCVLFSSRRRARFLRQHQGSGSLSICQAVDGWSKPCHSNWNQVLSGCTSN